MRNNQQDHQRPSRRVRILKRKAETFLIVLLRDREKEKDREGVGASDSNLF